METMSFIASLLLFVMVVGPAARAEDHTVGGSSGWTQGVDYSTWASSQTFTVGDNLVFNYDGSTHQVSQVSQAGYSSCSSSNAIKTYNDGSTTIPLTVAGSLHFICPVFGHCAGGMKLSINVVAATTAGTPASPTTETPASTTPSTTTPSTTTSPPPPSASATGGLPHITLLLMALLGITVSSFMS